MFIQNNSSEYEIVYRQNFLYLNEDQSDNFFFEKLLPYQISIIASKISPSKIFSNSLSVIAGGAMIKRSLKITLGCQSNRSTIVAGRSTITIILVVVKALLKEFIIKKFQNF